MSQPAPTTVMFRNMPRAYGPRELVREVAVHADPRVVDFVYVPSNGSTHSMGYGFVNFVASEALELVQEKMRGKSWSLAATTRRVKMLPANVHGLAPNLAHVEPKITTASAELRDVLVFVSGREISFREAVHLLRAGALQQDVANALHTTDQHQARFSSGPLPAISGQHAHQPLRLAVPRMLVASAGSSSQPWSSARAGGEPQGQNDELSPRSLPSAQSSSGDIAHALGFESQQLEPLFSPSRTSAAGRRSMIAMCEGRQAGSLGSQSEVPRGACADHASPMQFGQRTPSTDSLPRDLVLQSPGYYRVRDVTTSQLVELLRRSGYPPTRVSV